MAEKIAIVTDSTCDLPQALLAAEGIFMVPLSVFFEDEEYRDGVDLTPEQFYKKLQNSRQLPTTSQPSPGLFLDLFQRLKQEGYTEVLCIHLSRKFSGTSQSAWAAAKMMTGLRIEIIDSRQCTWALGALVLYAGKQARAGRPFAEIVNSVQEQIPKTIIYFSVDNLDALEKGGRIGHAKALAGKFLGVRPVLFMSGEIGEIEVLAKTYSAKSATELIARLAAEHIRRFGICQQLTVLHAVQTVNQDMLLAELKKTTMTSLLQPVTGSIGSVIGTHVGPTAWGIAIC